MDYSPRLISSYSSEVLYAMELCRERIFHSQVHPSTSVVSAEPRPEKDHDSGGKSRSDRNVSGSIQPEASLGVRIWPAGVETVDDLYGEPIGKEFNEPYSTLGSLKFNEDSDKEVSSNKFGQKFTFKAIITVPVIEHLERELPEPLEGDLIEFWANSWQELGVFYNITRVSRGGFINNSEHHTEWKLHLTRNEDFVPERRLLGSD